ncbi:uncharacterized protein LOC126843520 isoform X2 [Adelges cooleyi]|uniref:uncharacterized protein LOC126843520 isoform X2 n=1 Tax=Adelges cooleyi TaxID=133065 RepID=UPI00217F8055|nr:uncharacterized protein LOC126843520 isoform X2 [Adelges cooleyi]
MLKIFIYTTLLFVTVSYNAQVENPSNSTSNVRQKHSALRIRRSKPHLMINTSFRTAPDSSDSNSADFPDSSDNNSADFPKKKPSISTSSVRQKRSSLLSQRVQSALMADTSIRTALDSLDISSTEFPVENPSNSTSNVRQKHSALRIRRSKPHLMIDTSFRTAPDSSDGNSADFPDSSDNNSPDFPKTPTKPITITDLALRLRRHKPPLHKETNLPKVPKINTKTKTGSSLLSRRIKSSLMVDTSIRTALDSLGDNSAYISGTPSSVDTPETPGPVNTPHSSESVTETEDT